MGSDSILGWRNLGSAPTISSTSYSPAVIFSRLRYALLLCRLHRATRSTIILFFLYRSTGYNNNLYFHGRCRNNQLNLNQVASMSATFYCRN